MIQLEDLIVPYPKADTPSIQTLIDSKVEFKETSALPDEPAKKPGQQYNYQKFILRYMIPNDKILMMWETGTGKTCGIIGIVEYYYNLYLKDPATAPIRHCYYLSRPPLHDEIKKQIICRCTADKYLTPKIIQATTLKGRKTMITESLGKWYTFDTYTKFAKKIANLTDERIKALYSNCIFVCDEVHNLTTAESSEVGKGARLKEKTFTTIERVFNLVEHSKVILASATPMINQTNELKGIAELLGSPLPEDIDLNTITLEELEPYFRGKVSYVRASQIGVNVIEQGVEMEFPLELRDKTIDGKLTLYDTKMDPKQREAYLRAIEEEKNQKKGVYTKSRQAASFVFPDGSWGGKFPQDIENIKERAKATRKGLGKYVIKIKNGIYEATDELKEWLKVVPENQRDTIQKHLGRLSSKYEETIRKIDNDTTGTAFIYNTFVKGSGAIVHGLCFEENGYKPYRGDQNVFQELEGHVLAPPCAREDVIREISRDFPKAKRYAIITKEVSDVQTGFILDLFNSPQNKHGEYLKVLIGSEITKEGINLSHGTQIHIITPWWHEGATYQAKSRMLRSGSHTVLLDSLKEIARQRGEDPDLVSVEVDIFEHAAIAVEDEYGYDLDRNIDLKMYWMALQKSYSIKRVEHLLKQISVDCLINRARNILSPEHDYTNKCDYDVCDYDCFDSAAQTKDYSTYDIYYIKETTDQIIPLLVDELFNEFSTLSFDQILAWLLDRLPMLREREVEQALTDIIVNQIELVNKYGFRCFLVETDGVFSLVFNLNFVPKQIIDSTVYNDNLTAVHDYPFDDYIKEISEVEQGSIIKEIIEDQTSFDPKILLPSVKVQLLEAALIDYLNGNVTENVEAILNLYDGFIFATYEPINELTLIKNKFKNKSLDNKRSKMSEDDYIDQIDDIHYSNIDLNEDNLVILHTLNDVLFEQTAYTESVRAHTGNAYNIRIYHTGEGVWRDVEPIERLVYIEVIKRIATERIAPYEDAYYDFFGIVYKISPNDFRIRYKVSQDDKVTSKNKLDKRFKKRSKMCSGTELIDLYEMLWRLRDIEPSYPPDEDLVLKLPESKDELVALILKERPKFAKEISDWPKKKLLYVATWLIYFGANKKSEPERICSILRNKMEQANRIYYI